MTDQVRGSLLPKVIIDIAPLFEDHWTGIPIFTRRLIQALIRHGDIDVQFAFKLSQIPESAVMAAIRAGTGTFLRGDFERDAGKRHPLIDKNARIFYPSVKEFFNVSPHEASTVHDVSALTMPEFHKSSNVDYHMNTLARQIDTDEIVFCVSEATRAALTLAYPSIMEKTRILPQYVDWPDSFPAMERNLPPPLAGRYAAVIGTVEPRKNLALLIRALEEPRVGDSDIRFVVMGKQGWNVEQMIGDLTSAQRDRLVFLGYVSEFMKYRLLKHCEFLVYPSIYEGFGIPALEAMSLGKPVLASMTSSFPELIGDAGVYFDPLSVAEFADAFDVIADERKAAELSLKALASAGLYDSERMARAVIDWITNAA
jgi:glycosyltransferase involved in cell wall biosynthesis